jgi:small ligand-binding sensory domain FIST
MPPRFAAALSTAADLQYALGEVCDTALDQLKATPHLALVFVSADRAAQCGEIAGEVSRRIGTENLMGCTGESIVGTGREIEGETALSLWMAHLPGASLTTMHLDFARSPEGGAIVGWPGDLPAELPEGAALLVLGEPFSFPADMLLERMNEDRPGLPVIGGMASGASSPGENRLLLGDVAHTQGAVAVLLSGGVRMRTVVSQGCRPIGKHMVVTKAERNVIHALGGKPALLVLKELFDTLPTQEQAMVQRGLHVGRVVSEYQDEFRQGDFLVRNVIGIDPDDGAIAIGDYVRAGQTVQFHIRDWQSADVELRQLLERIPVSDAARGGLLFTCNGRGTRLFPEPHHDARSVQASLGDIPLAGFFAAGELGPIGGKNFMHGFTASLAVFEGAE